MPITLVDQIRLREQGVAGEGSAELTAARAEYVGLLLRANKPENLSAPCRNCKILSLVRPIYSLLEKSRSMICSAATKSNWTGRKSNAIWPAKRS